MASATLFARTVARTSFGSALRAAKVVTAPRIGAVRLSSYFTPAHEYVKVKDGVGTVGITDFAQSALGDIVFVDLPEVGEEYEKGDSFGSVESVKAASDVYAPVAGKVVEVNENISDDPSLVNADPEGNAWFIKIALSDPKDLVGLMDAAAYKAHCEKEAH